MRIYSEDKLRKRVSILRMSGAMNQLNDNGLIELTKCELLLENHLKIISIYQIKNLIN